MIEVVRNQPLQRTPLYQLHLAAGARMVPFAGYEMPLQYPSGIIKEHLHTRAAASLFDVSHMGQIALRPRAGRIDEAAAALETLVPGDIIGLVQGRQRYTLFTNASGGIIDDLMVSHQGDHFLLVVNAARKERDDAHLRKHLSASCIVEPLRDRALLALQGPMAEAVLATFTPEVRAMRFLDVRVLALLGTNCIVSRSGYTGEDGFEISAPADRTEELWHALLQHEAVAPAGLGARDSLRLEAGLCLYDADLDETTTPVEAALEWTVPAVRRPGGARDGGFPGAQVIFAQLAQGTRRRRVGLRPEGRAPVRGGTPLFPAAQAATPIGVVTSGGYGASVGAPIAMGYVAMAQSASGTQLFAEVRGKRLPIRVSPLPFVPPRYKR